MNSITNVKPARIGEIKPKLMYGEVARRERAENYLNKDFTIIEFSVTDLTEFNAVSILANDESGDFVIDTTSGVIEDKLRQAESYFPILASIKKVKGKNGFRYFDLV